MKILLLGEYSGLNRELKNALEMLGHDVTLAAANDFWKNIEVDINLGSGNNIYSYKFNQLLKPIIKRKLLTDYDVVHVINFYLIPRSVILNNWLVRFLKKNNNIVTLSGAGDDPFFVNYSEECLNYSPIPSHEKYDRRSAYYMRGKYPVEGMHHYMSNIDGVIPIMYEYYATFCKAGYKKKTSLPVPIPIDISKIEPIDNKCNGRVVFFHGLNRPGFKGTHLIQQAFRDFGSKYPNDVRCIIDGKMSFNKYIEFIRGINVSVDQVYSYSLAMNALYSMAQRKVVLGGVERESSILYQGELPPAFNIKPTVKDIYQNLEKILDMRRDIPRIGEESREFLGRYHNPLTVAEKYLKFWQLLGVS